MKKTIKELRQKTISELEKEVITLKKEVTKLKIEAKVNPPKDTNLLLKKRKRFAQILTVLGEKKEQERLKKIM